MNKHKPPSPLPPDAWFDAVDRTFFPPLSAEDFEAEHRALEDPLIRKDAADLKRAYVVRRAVLRGGKARGKP